MPPSVTATVTTLPVPTFLLAKVPVAPATLTTSPVNTPVSAILHHAGLDVSIRRPKGHKGKEKTLFMLPPDAFAIIEGADKINAEMGRLLRFLLYTGCRIGEALNLR